jgi:hypothetical protein
MSAYITMKCRICRATYTTPVLGDGRHSVLCPAGHMSTETTRPSEWLHVRRHRRHRGTLPWMPVGPLPMTRCATCQRFLPAPTGRGRPRVRCEPCQQAHRREYLRNAKRKERQ